MLNKLLSAFSTVALTTILGAQQPGVNTKTAQQQQPFQQGERLSPEKYPAAYNAPAVTCLQTPSGRWFPDVFVDLSFIYWRAEEDGLDLANSAALLSNGAVPPQQIIATGTPDSVVFSQENEYSPGFKVGIGTDFHEWATRLEYTWVRQTTTDSRAAPVSSLGGIPVWMVVNNWIQQASSVTGQALSATHISSKWHLGVDLLDLEVSRPYYEGRNLTIAPFMGLRAAWIRQSLTLTATIPSTLVVNPSGNPVVSRNHSNSWALGPRVGLGANCLLSRGFRLEGNAAGSLLFTQYTTIGHSENNTSATGVPATMSTTITDYDCVRPVAELGLGFGWGRYLHNQRYHIDFSLTYDFTLFWQQNMIRKLVDQAVIGSGAAAGNLDLHGLTLTGRFDF